MKHISLVLIAIVMVTLWFSGCAEKAVEKPVKQPTEKPTGGGGKVLTLKSSAYEDGQKMPVKYANTGVSGGENVSIPLSWENPPEGTKSFAIALVDRHQIANNFVHWLVINIPSSTTSLSEGASGTSNMPSGSKELNSDFGSRGYGGPQPPSGSGDHDYETTIYALSVESLNLGENTTLAEFEAAIQGKVLGSAKLTGKFGR